MKKSKYWLSSNTLIGCVFIFFYMIISTFNLSIHGLALNNIESNIDNYSIDSKYAALSIIQDEYSVYLFYEYYFSLITVLLIFFVSQLIDLRTKTFSWKSCLLGLIISLGLYYLTWRIFEFIGGDYYSLFGENIFGEIKISDIRWASYKHPIPILL